MACDDADQCRHQAILALPSMVSQSWPNPRLVITTWGLP
jgi:hypothetical protein